MAFMKDHHLVTSTTDHDQSVVGPEMFDLNSSEPQIRHYNKMKAGSVMGKVSNVQHAEGGLESRLFVYDMDPIMPPYDNVYDDLVLQVPLKDKFELEEDNEDEHDRDQLEQSKEEHHPNPSDEDTNQEATEVVDTDGVHSDKPPLDSDDPVDGAEPNIDRESLGHASEQNIENVDMSNTESIRSREEMDDGSTTIKEESPSSDTVQEEESLAENITSANTDEVYEDEISNHQHDSIEVDDGLDVENTQTVEAESIQEKMEDNIELESRSSDQEMKVTRENIQIEKLEEDEFVMSSSNEDIRETEVEVSPNDNTTNDVDSIESEEGNDAENGVPSVDQGDMSIIVDQSISNEDTKLVDDVGQEEFEGSVSDTVDDSQSFTDSSTSDAHDEIILDHEPTEANSNDSNIIQHHHEIMTEVKQQDVPIVDVPIIDIDQLDTDNTNHKEEIPTFVEPEHEQSNPSNDTLKETDIGNQIDHKEEAIIENETFRENGESTVDGDKDEYDTEPVAKSAQNNLANDEFISGLNDVDKFFEEVDPPDELDVGASGLSMQDVLVGQGVQIIKTRIVKGVEQVKRISNELKVVLAKKWITFKEFLDDHFDINIDDILLSTIESFESIAEQYQNMSEIVSDKLSDLKGNLEGPYEMAKTFYDDELSGIVKRMKQALSKIGLLEDYDDEEEDKDNDFVFENFKIDSFDTEEMQRRLDETRSKLM